MLDHVFISLPTLETDRMYLRKLLYSDQEDIFEYASNPLVAEHLLWDAHQSEFDTIQFLNIVYAAYNHNKAAPWGIELKLSKKIIGTAGFVYWEKDNKEAEVGYAISQQYWNQGLVTEAVSKIIKFGFEELRLKKITSRCKPDNTGSYKVLEKSGFIFDGIVENQMFMKGKLEDMRMYSYPAEKYFFEDKKLE